MKKCLSLILALAMVLTAVPLAFAEGEDTTSSYDLAYAFTLAEGKTFAGGAEGLISDYDGGLTPALSQKITNDDIAVEARADLFALGYWWKETYYGNSYLNRPSVNHFAPADTKNVNYDTGMTSLAFTYNSSVDSDSGDYVGDEETYGTLAYNFGAGRIDELAMTSDTGTTNNSYTSAQSLPVIRFKAPKSGYINPVIKLATLDADGLLYRVRKVHLLDTTKKLNSVGWITKDITDTTNAIWTEVYPKAGETTYTRAATNINEVIAPLEGWAKAPANVMTTRQDALIYVEAGDELELIFGKTGSDNTQFAIDTLRMDYVDKFTLENTVSYKASSPTLDISSLLSASDLPASGMTYTVAEGSQALLTKVETGVYTIKDTIADGTVLTVTAANEDITITVNITVSVPKLVYDLSEAYAVTNTFNGDAVADYASNLTPVTAMNKANTWYLAYGWSADGYSASYAHTKLTRPVYNAFAPNDKENPFRLDGTGYESLSFSYSNPTSQTVNGVTYATNRSVAYGNIAYNFSGGYLRDTSTLHVGGTDYLAWAVPQIVFTAPKAGLINPKLVIGTNYDENRDLAYRVFKNSIENNIYPKDGEASTTAKISPKITSTAMQSGWAVSEYGTMTTRDDAYIWVEKGDKIYILFETLASDYKQMNYTIDTVQMIYTYVPEETIDITYNGTEEKTVDVAGIVSSYGLTGTPTYTLTDDDGALVETGTQGVYKVVANTLTPAIITATVGDVLLTVRVNSNAGASDYTYNGSAISGTVNIGTTNSGKNVFALAYDAEGNILGVEKETTVAENGDIAFVVASAIKPAYVRLFMWDSLENIQPYSAALTIH